MDLMRVVDVVKDSFMSSSIFPFRTGQLKDNFFDKNVYQLGEKDLGFEVIKNKDVYYGKILEIAPSIKYRTRNGYIKHKNRHYMFIENIIENDTVPAIEKEFGVKRI